MEINSNTKTSYDQVFLQTQLKINNSSNMNNNINKEEIDSATDYNVNLKSTDFSYNKEIGEFVIKVHKGKSSIPFQMPTEEIVRLKEYLRETA